MVDAQPAVAADPIEADIRRYVAYGYRVQARTATSAQLVKPKTFNFLAALLWFLLFGFGLVLYLGYYLSKQDDTVYLSLGPDGKITRQASGRGPVVDPTEHASECPSCGYQNRHARTLCKACHAPLPAVSA